MNGTVALRQVSGSVVVSTINGKVQIKIDKLDKTRPISVITVHGQIELTLPGGAAADLSAATVSGQVYCDITPTREQEQQGKKNKSAMQGKLNGGGTNIHLQSLSGNIYIRQQ